MYRHDTNIAVYVLVYDHYQATQAHRRLRRDGCILAHTDQQTSTIESCGEYFKLDINKDIADHIQDWFPCLRDRSPFVHQSTNPWYLNTFTQQHSTRGCGHADDPVQAIGTLPLPHLARPHDVQVTDGVRGRLAGIVPHDRNLY